MKDIAFERYLQEQIKDTSTLYSSYKGITKKDFPKWKGWKVINSYKAIGIAVSDINDEKLDTLVENFYYIKFLQETI